MSTRHLSRLISEFDQEFEGHTQKAFKRVCNLQSIKALCWLPLLDWYLLSLMILVVPLCLVLRTQVQFAILVVVLIVGCFTRWLTLIPRQSMDIGTKLKREQAPELFRFVEGVAQNCSCPIPDELIIDEKLNASAGWRRTNANHFFRQRVMVLGLFLLELLTSTQLRGMVAHELQHFRDSRSWSLEIASIVYWTLRNRHAFEWQRRVAYFHWQTLVALTVVQARKNELAADAATSSEIGNTQQSICHLKFAILSHFLDRILADETDEEPSPTLFEDTVAELLTTLQDQNAVRNAIAKIEFQVQDMFSIHPSIVERSGEAVRLYKEDPSRVHQSLNSPVSISFLTNKLRNELLTAENENWHKQELANWNQRQSLSTSDTDAGDANELDSLWLQLDAAVACNQWATILKVGERALAIRPDDQEVGFQRARARVRLGELSAINDVLDMTGEGFALSIQEKAFDFLQRYFCREGMRDCLNELELKYDQLTKRRIQFESQKRNWFSHQLGKAKTDGVMVGLCHQLFVNYPEIRRVCVARQYIRVCKKTRYLVFALDLNPSRNALKILEAVRKEMKFVRAETTFYSSKRQPLICRKIRRLPGSLIYRRGDV